MKRLLVSAAPHGRTHCFPVDSLGLQSESHTRLSSAGTSGIASECPFFVTSRALPPDTQGSAWVTPPGLAVPVWLPRVRSMFIHRRFHSTCDDNPTPSGESTSSPRKNTKWHGVTRCYGALDQA